MAKGNLFLGFGAGKVGDVVFYRANNEQMARARNRRPANPNSVKQRVQRAVLASVARLYSIGYEIFDHAFENEKVGVGSQRAFLRHNAPILRSLVVSDLNQQLPASECRGRVTAPRLAVAVPFEGMCLSYGSLQQSYFQRSVRTDGVSIFFLSPIIASDTTIASYARRTGLIPGDIYTIVGITVDSGVPASVRYDANLPGEDSGFKVIYQSEFVYTQLKVKAGILENETEITDNTLISALFDIEGRGKDNFESLVFDEPLSLSLLGSSFEYGVWGVILSREDSGLRSESFAYLGSAPSWGLTSDNIAKVWGLEAGLSGSELILEGEEFQNG